MVGNNVNLDILQLGGRLGGTLDIAKILALYPEWDCSPRCLHLPGLKLNGTEIPVALDHLSPLHWKGNTHVKLVLLITSWHHGCTTVKDNKCNLNLVFLVYPKHQTQILIQRCLD
ncbi:hypothetical protein B0H34DRAFT_710631 [Crassisporium funariophilum]|nr:hypothetical protein B0H34DRAFT_710631 [Crassisporium funariophilum]